MSTVLYSNKIRDPRSKSVDPADNFLVCKKINNKWHIIQSEWSAKRAKEAKEILANHDLINGHITDTNTYSIFLKNLSEIKQSL